MPAILSKPLNSSESFIIGSGSTATTVSLPKPSPSWIPGSSQGKEETAVLFKAIATRLKPHISKHSLAELLEPFATILDIHTDTCTTDVDTTLLAVAHAFFDPSKASLSVLSFCDWSGDKLRAAADPEDRFAEEHGTLAYVHTQSLLNPSTIDDRLPSKVLKLTFFLGLPQSPSPADPAVANLANPAPNPAANAPGNVPASARKGVIPVGNGAAGALGYTYTGAFDFFETKAKFDTTFGSDLDNIEILPANAFAAGTYSSRISAMDCFEPLSRTIAFPLAYQVMWNQAISGDTKAGTVSFHSIFAQLRKLKYFELPANGKGPSTFYDPTQLYRRFQPLVVLLSSDDADVEIWGETLFSVYTANLRPDVNELIHDPTKEFFFQPPPLRQLVTYQVQTHALNLARTKAQMAHDSIQSTMELILQSQASQAKTHPFSRSSSAFHATHDIDLPPYPTSLPIPPTSIDDHHQTSPTTHAHAHYHGQSPADSVIQQNTFPKDPRSDFTSPFFLGFKGCLGCGEPSHQFRDCPGRSKPDILANFRLNFRCHRPDWENEKKRRNNPNPNSRFQNPDPVRPRRDDPALFPPRDPAPNQRAPPTSQGPPNPRTNNAFPAFTRVLNTNVRPYIRPPISTDNNLGNISIPLADSSGNQISELVGLLDSGASLSTGTFSFHIWFQQNHPECVVSLELASDVVTPFTPIQLSGCLLENPTSIPDVSHGQLSAVATYRAAFLSANGSPAEIRVALGHDNSLNTIFGLPMMRAMGLNMDLETNTARSRSLKVSFPLEFFEPQLFQPSEPLSDDAIRHHALQFQRRPPVLPSASGSIPLAHRPSVTFANPILDPSPAAPAPSISSSFRQAAVLATPPDSTPDFTAASALSQDDIGISPDVSSFRADPSPSSLRKRPPSCPPSLPSPASIDNSSLEKALVPYERPMFHFCRRDPSYFASIDLQAGFHHIPIAASAQSSAARQERLCTPAARSLFAAPAFTRSVNSTLSVTPTSPDSADGPDFRKGG